MDLPQGRDLTIVVDKENEAILLPIFGSMVSFQISTVKRVTSHHYTGRIMCLQVVFNVPVPVATPALEEFDRTVYVRDLTFKCNNQKHVSEVVQSIRALLRQVNGEGETLVTEELQLVTSDPIRISGLSIRPNFGGDGEELRGKLEVHTNGFLYATKRSQLHIMFENIKHAIFQQAENEKTILHFHLHNSILVGKKKTIDVQFFVEVKTVVGGKRDFRATRDRKNKISLDFQNFVTRVNEIWSHSNLRSLNLSFDQPMREFGFRGTLHKLSTFLRPARNCLVEILRSPFVVITLKEIEVVNLEKIGSHLDKKHLDMTIVFEDFKLEVMQIRMIDIKAEDRVKTWLGTTDVKYYLSELLHNWHPLLNNSDQHPQQLTTEGGGERLNLEADDSDYGDLQELDQGYEEFSDVQSHSDSEDEDDD